MFGRHFGEGSILIAQWIEHLPSVWEAISLIPVRDLQLSIINVHTRNLAYYTLFLKFNVHGMAVHCTFMVTAQQH